MWNEVAAAIETIGVVSGEFGMVEAYEHSKLASLAAWKSDEDERVRNRSRRRQVKLYLQYVVYRSLAPLQTGWLNDRNHAEAVSWARAGERPDALHCRRSAGSRERQQGVGSPRSRPEQAAAGQ